jgi:hypothetical protein
MTDLINHPPHYKADGIEVIDVIEAFDLNYRLGNVVKYVLRHNYKGSPENDLRKASWYLDREIGKYAEAPTANPSGLIYLATPYTLLRNRAAAAKEAARLTGCLALQGYSIFSPIAHSHAIAQLGNIDPLDHAFWLKFNQPFLVAAMALVVAHMDGWQESKGIAHEIAFFKECGKPIYDLDPKTLQIMSH